ncbi:MAG: BON domain-containing protein [Dehalococcoidia bacterium]|nr:BON domain-containing protein [Dehalococcoidia bacterium]
MDRISALRLGSKIRFQDRWRGTLAGFEVDEEWAVLNILVQSGALFWRAAVKLPFAIAGEWSDEHVALDCNSFKAFARDLPPVAAPARPVSGQTPIAMAGARLAGLLVSRNDRRATEVLIRHGAAGAIYRIRTAEAKFEGKTLTPAVQVEKMPLYRSDGELQAAAAAALAADHILAGDEKRTIVVQASAGVVTVRGNVRNAPARERIQQIAARIPGIMALHSQVVDDVHLEAALGLALERAGLQRIASVYVRSSLGEVVLFGRAPALAVIEDVVREAGRAPGVRAVTSRMEIAPAAAQTGGRLPGSPEAALA